jgi:hypothetical protein
MALSPWFGVWFFTLLIKQVDNNQKQCWPVQENCTQAPHMVATVNYLSA